VNIKQISVSVKFTKNLGNYQSFVCEAGLVAEIEPGEDTGGAFSAAYDMAKHQVRTQLKSVKYGGMNHE